MKNLLPLLVTGLFSLPLAANAGSEEFYTSIPATGSVAGFVDFDGAAQGYASVNVTQSDNPKKTHNGGGGQFIGYFSTVAAVVAENSNPASLFFRFFCMDLYQVTTDAPTAYSASQYNSNSNLQKLYDIAYPNEQLGDFFDGSKTSFGQFSGSGTTAQDYSGAFQLAVWELVYEKNPTHSLDTGNFTNALTTSNAHTIANGWLSQVDSYIGTGFQNWQLYSFASGTNQDFLSARYSVPEPGSLLLAGLGLAGLAMVSRRRRNKV